MLRRSILAILLLFLCGVASAQSQSCVIETFAGGDSYSIGDGLPALEAEFLLPRDARRGPDGLLYITDAGNHRIRRVRADGLVETIAGTGVDGVAPDGAIAQHSALGAIGRMQFGPDGLLHFVGARIRRISASGTLETVAGNGEGGSSGDGGAATAAELAPTAFAFDQAGALLVGGDNRIRRIDKTGIISTIAGVEQGDRPVESGDGGPATEARLVGPHDIAVGPDGLIYFPSFYRGI